MLSLITTIRAQVSFTNWLSFPTSPIDYLFPFHQYLDCEAPIFFSCKLSSILQSYCIPAQLFNLYEDGVLLMYWEQFFIPDHRKSGLKSSLHHLHSLLLISQPLFGFYPFQATWFLSTDCTVQGRDSVHTFTTSEFRCNKWTSACEMGVSAEI